MKDLRVKLATHQQFRDRTNNWTNQVHLWNSKLFKNENIQQIRALKFLSEIKVAY